MSEMLQPKDKSTALVLLRKILEMNPRGGEGQDEWEETLTSIESFAEQLGVSMFEKIDLEMSLMTEEERKVHASDGFRDIKGLSLREQLQLLEKYGLNDIADKKL